MKEAIQKIRRSLEATSAERLVIRALDGTWHRPLTTLELAALQGLPTQIDGEWLQLAGGSKARWRKRIGNAVPPATAEAIARERNGEAETRVAQGTFKFVLLDENDRPRAVAERWA